MTESASQLLHGRTQELNPIFCYNRLGTCIKELKSMYLILLTFILLFFPLQLLG